MGNASSTPQPGAKPNSSFHRRFPSRPPQESARPKSPSTQHTQKPLRNKKRSLELPDLASLGLGITPSNSSSSAQRDRGRTTHSSPINIPVSPHIGTNKARPRPQNNTSYSNIESDDEYVAYKDPPPERRERGRQPRTISRDQPHAKPAAQIVNSTISTGLVRKPGTTPTIQADEDGIASPTCRQSTDDIPPTLIRWHGGGEHVLLARAGDDDWKGRTPMTRESPDSPYFTVNIPLRPGTHHFRFLVDGVWRIDERIPTAVDEQGSLANYIAVGLQIFNPSPISSSPPPRPIARSLPPGSSFWIETPSGSSTNLSADTGPTHRTLHPYESGRWTSVIPPELVAAAKEEEAWIAASEAAQASGSRHRDRNPPPLPPAPALPRHLEKLILNVRSPGVATPRPAGSPVGARRSADPNSHPRAATRSLRRSVLTMEAEADSPSSETGPSKLIPVTTASGTDVSRAGLESVMTPLSPVPHNNERSERDRQEREKADKLAERAQYEPGLADDSSMLPVPNHVVLHHLSTSAIKNGLLAVASTNRYRNKYLTTVYYKPTDT